MIKKTQNNKLYNDTKHTFGLGYANMKKILEAMKHLPCSLGVQPVEK